MSPSLKIGISGSTLLPTRNGGRPDGMAVYTRHLFEGLQNLSQETSLWLYKKDEDYHGQLDDANYFPHTFGFLSLISALSSRKIIISPSIDIFHTTDYRSFRIDCPSVSTLYDAIPLAHPEMANPHFRNIKNFILKRSAKYSDHIITVSNYAAKEIVEYYEIPSRNISVVPCGIGSSWLEPLNEINWNRTLIKRNIRSGYFLFVGIIQPRKNLDTLIKAHDHLHKSLRQKHPLVVVGRKGWSCDDVIEKLKRKISINEAHWFNDVNTEIELKHLYAGAMAFVYPSLHEGFGLPLLEAFASGLPAMISSTTSLPEVSQGIAVEVDPFDIDGMSKAMVKLLDPVDRIERINAGKKRAREMSWENTAKQTLEVYKKVLA